MIVAGIGCRSGASAQEIEAAIAEALRRAGLPADAPDVIAAPAMKGAEAGIAAAAAARGLALVLVPPQELDAAASRTLTHSPRVVALTGLPSVSEAAALAAGGPAAKLVAPRTAVGPATCALAQTGDAA